MEVDEASDSPPKRTEQANGNCFVRREIPSERYGSVMGHLDNRVLSGTVRCETAAPSVKRCKLTIFIGLLRRKSFGNKSILLEELLRDLEDILKLVMNVISFFFDLISRRLARQDKI